MGLTQCHYLYLYLYLNFFKAPNIRICIRLELRNGRGLTMNEQMNKWIAPKPQLHANERCMQYCFLILLKQVLFFFLPDIFPNKLYFACISKNMNELVLEFKLSTYEWSFSNLPEAVRCPWTVNMFKNGQKIYSVSRRAHISLLVGCSRCESPQRIIVHMLDLVPGFSPDSLPDATLPKYRRWDSTRELRPATSLRFLSNSCIL